MIEVLLIIIGEREKKRIKKKSSVKCSGREREETSNIG